MSDTVDDTDSNIGLNGDEDYQDQLEQAQFRQTAPGVYSPTPAPAPQQALTPPAPRAARPPPFDPSSAKPTGESFSFPPQKVETSSSLWQDAKTAAWNGALGMGQDLAGFASAVTNQITSDPGVRDWVGSWQAGLAKNIQDNIETMSDADKKAYSASVLGWIPGRLGQDAQGNRIPSPSDVGFGRYAALTTAEFIPQALSFILPETLGAKLGLWAVSKVGIATKTAEGLTAAGQTAATIGGSAATGTLFGAQNVGAVFDKVADLVGSASDQEMMQNPAYAQLRADGKSVGDAKNAIINNGARLIASFAVGAVAGAGTGALLTRGALGAGERGMLGRAAIGAAEGGVTMGAQGAANSALEQQAKGPVDLGSVMADAVASGVQGAAMGAVGGVAHGRGEARESEPEIGEDPDVKTAMTSALQIEGPEQPLLLTHDTAGQQALPAPTDTSINVPAGPGQIVPPPPPSGPVSFRDVNVAPVTRAPEPAPPAPETPTPPPETPTAAPAAPSPPPAAQAAIDTSQGATRGTAPAPAQPHALDGMTKAQQVDAVMTLPGQQLTQKTLQGMSSERLKALYTKLAPDAETTTVVSGADRPPSEPPASPAVRGDAATPSPVGVGSLPVAAEAAAPRGPATASSPPSAPAKAAPKTDTTGLAGMGSGMAKAMGENLRDKLWDQVQKGETTEAGQTSNILVAAKRVRDSGGMPTRAEFDAFLGRVGPLLSDRSPGWQQRFMEAAHGTPAKAAEAVRVSKRQQAKASMQQPAAEPVAKPAVHADQTPVPLEEITPVAAREAEQARTERIQDLGDAVREIAAPKGSALEATIRKAQRYLAEAIGKTDGSKDAVAELIHNWIQDQPTKPIPGGKITPRMLGEHIMERVTGQRPVEPEGRAREIAQAGREDVARTAGEPKAIAPGEAEGVAETRSEGAEGTSALTPGVKSDKVPDTTDRKRVADNLIQKVLNHEITMEQAEQRYGKPQAGPGRARRWATVADRLKDWIAHAEDPEAERKILLELAKTQNDKDLTPHQKSTATKKLQTELARTGPEFAAELRGHLDPVGREADLQALREQAQARTAALKGEGNRPVEDAPGPPISSGIDPRSSRYVRMSQDPRVGANYERLFRAHDEHDMPLLAHDAARVIAQDTMMRAEQEPLRQVAQRFADLVPKDVPIMSIERARAEGRISQEVHDDLLARNVYGAYDPDSRTILQNINATRETGTHVETALHEMSHAISWHYLDNLKRYDPRHTDLQVLNAIRNELRDHVVSEHAAGRLSEAETQRLFKAVSNIDELHTQMFTDPVVHGFAADRVASPGFRAKMASLGRASPPGASIWRSFANWVRKAVGQPPARSASEHTLFDHIIQPMADIQTRAAEYNKRLLPQDPELRARAEPMYDAASSALSRASREIADHVDIRGLGDRARRWLLQGATSDGIISRYARLLPGLENWRAAYESIAKSSSDFANKYVDKVKNLTSRYDKLDDPQALGRLMTDATLARAHLGPDAANPHLTTDAEKAALAALQARYNKLPPDAKALYGEYRDTYAAWFKQKRAAELGALVRGFMPDATDAQHEALTNALTRRSSLDNFLKDTAKADATTSSVARAFGDQWQANRALARGIAQVHAQGFVQGDYFPLRRFGNYVVRYGDKATPGDYGVEMFESRRKAEERRAELAAAGLEPYQVSSKRESDLRDIVPNHPAVDELTASLSKRGYSEDEAREVRDTLNGILLQHASHSTAARAAQGMRRRGVLGASADQSRVLSNEFLNNQVAIGHLEHGMERAKALSQMRNVDLPALESQNYKGHSGDALTAASVLHEVEQRSKAINADSVVSSVGARVNTFSFAQSLMSPSHMLTSSMEAHTNSMALLGARHGVFKASAALGRALAQTSPMLKTGAWRTLQAVKGELKAADWNLPELLKQRMITKGSNKAGMAQLFRELENANLIDHTMLKDIQQQANPTSRAGGIAYNTWARFRDFSAASAHAVDVMNKTAIAKAAFDLEYAKTKDVNAAVKYAVDITRKAMPNYNSGNKARIATSRGILGPLGSPLFQFKNYGLHMYTVLANLAHESMHGENKAEARKAFALLMASHAAMAGVLGLPIADAIRYIGGAYDLITGAPKPHNYENDVRQGIASVFGPQLGELISRGLPHAAGIDVHRRVSLSNLLEVPEMTSFDKNGVGEVLTGLALGASGENLQSAFGGVMKILQGDFLGGVQAAIPRPFRDVMKAGGLADAGVTTQRGRVLVKPDQIGPGAVAAQALGFQPAIASEAREGSAAVQEALAEAQARHTELTQRWLKASPAERQNVWQEIQLYNQQPGSLGFQIKMDQLLRDQRQQQKRSQVPGGYDLRLPRAATRQLIGAGAFANVQ